MEHRSPAVQFKMRRREMSVAGKAATARYVNPRVAALYVDPLVAALNTTPRVAALREQSARANRTGIPDGLRSSIERLSGVSLEGVKVHYNSPRPASIRALAYARGAEIHLGPGQERQLAHEAWHAAQQRQGRVRTSLRMGGMPVNADPALEREADAMGARAQGERALPPGGAVVAPVSAAGAEAPLQARWMPGANPGEYYWEGRGEARTPLPPGGREVPPPPLATMADTAGRSGGSMRSLRTQSDHPEAPLHLLAHYGSQAADGRGLFYNGPSTMRGLGPTPVLPATPVRDPGEHRRIFGGMTGGETSSTRYQESIGTAAPGTRYEILHGMGHGEGGAPTQDPRNLASASAGANTEMIPFDHAVSGNPDVMVDTEFVMRDGTERAEAVHQRFTHRDFPGEPFHERRIDGDRPPPTRSEYDGLERQASRYEPENLDGAASLIHMSRGDWGLPPR